MVDNGRQSGSICMDIAEPVLCPGHQERTKVPIELIMFGLLPQLEFQHPEQYGIHA